MKQSKSNIVILILGMIVAVLVAAVIILQVTDNGKNPAGGPDRTDSMLLNTPSPELSASPKEETETPSAATATAPATAAPSATLSEATPSATYTEGNFGFLEGISRDYFEDAKAEDGGSWYPGAVQRQSDGTVVYKWDRYASTLRTLEKYDAIYRKNTDQKVVYLTFDCGYENGYTARILDILKEKDVKAIFFVTGDYLNDKSTKEIVLRMLSEGHLIGNHTDRHPNMTQVSDEEFVKQLRNVEAKLKAIAGGEAAMSYYRPPEGASTRSGTYVWQSIWGILLFSGALRTMTLIRISSLISRRLWQKQNPAFMTAPYTFCMLSPPQILQFSEISLIICVRKAMRSDALINRQKFFISR